jgi:cytochrome c peroxidase
MERQSSLILFSVSCAILVLAIGCSSQPKSGSEGASIAAMPAGQRAEIKAPLGLPPVPIPEDNPPTMETIALGRRLYYDPILSSDGTVSCASCHGPDVGFADPRQFSVGVGGKKGGRQAPSVINAAYYTTQFWDGRAASLEEQAVGPMQNPVEMAHTIEGVTRALAQDKTYVAEFERAFGPGPVTIERAAKAIASFERTILSGNSPFDRYMYVGEQDALNASAKRGLQIFRDPKKANCAVCHTITEEYALFTDNKFHNLGVGANLDGTLQDKGRYEVSKQDADHGAFKTPTLRNIAQTAPYMHDGSLKTLKEVVDFYVGAGNSNSWRDKEIKELGHLTGQERQDLEAFLESLTGELPAETRPLEMTTSSLR